MENSWNCTKAEKREYMRNKVVDLLRDGLSFKEVCTQLDINPSTILSWKRKYPAWANLVDEAIQGKEILLYSEALNKIATLAEQGNVEALKLLCKQLQGSARKAGYSGSDIKQSNISIDASDNRQINLSNLLSNDTVDKLRSLKAAENVAVVNSEGGGGKVE
jgi:transposase